MSGLQEKYMKALRSIEQILKANRQIRDELDALRAMRQAEIDSYANVQKEEFRKAYDALLREKNQITLANQALELQNQRLKDALEQRQSQEQRPRQHEEETHPEGEGTPKKETKEVETRREAELRRTIENYEEHHATLQHNIRRLEERNVDLENKLSACEKSWRAKFQAKEVEVVEVKSRARQELGEQVDALRKENAVLRLASSEAVAKLQHSQQGALFAQQLQSMDWQGDLLRELAVVQANLEPLRQQVSSLHQSDIYQRQQAARERVGLQTRVAELEADVQRQAETIRLLEEQLLKGEKKAGQASGWEEEVHRLEEEKQLLQGRIIVMQAREVALRSRTGEELQERVLQFENRIDLLLANKEGLRELREVGIHQLIALKAYILELDSRLKELLQSNSYLLRKYKSYKQKYQSSLTQLKQVNTTITTLKMKMVGYDRLVLKLQAELQAAVRVPQPQGPRKSTEETNSDDLYRRKYELIQEKMQLEQKYHSQEMETFKLNYQTRIVELTIKVEENKSLKEAVLLYRNKNEQLQGLLARKESEAIESRVLRSSKISNSLEPTPPRPLKDPLPALQATIRAHEDTISRLQAQLRNSEEANRRALRKLEKELEDSRDNHKREVARKELDFSLTLDQEVKKYKLRVAELEYSQQQPFSGHQRDGKGEMDERLRVLQRKVEVAEQEKEDEVFNRRRLQKQVLDLSQDRDDLQRSNNQLQLTISHLRASQRNDGTKTLEVSQGRDYHLDYQIQSKDAIIRRLNAQIEQLKDSASNTSQNQLISYKTQINFLKRENEQLKTTLANQRTTITSHSTNYDQYSKTVMDFARNKQAAQLQQVIIEKEALISRLKSDLSSKETKIVEYEQQASKFAEQIRRFKRNLSEIDSLRYQITRLESQLLEKDRIINQLRSQQSSLDIEVDRIRQELAFVKENYQRISFQEREKGDQIARLKLELTTAQTRGNAEVQNRFTEELIDKEKQYSRLHAEFLALKSALSSAQEEGRHWEDSYRRANNELLSIRQQNTQLKEENHQLNVEIAAIQREVSQMRVSLEGYHGEREDNKYREEENYRIRTELFSLKSEISSLQEEVFSKESSLSRATNETIFLQAHTASLKQELQSKQQLINRLTAEYNRLREEHQNVGGAVEDRQTTILRLNAELTAIKQRKHEVEEELEERSRTFITLGQELQRLKTNLGFYEDEIEAKGRQNSKLKNQKETLNTQLIRIEDLLNVKQQQINKLRQQLIAARFQANQKEHDEKTRVEREIYSFKGIIASLQRELSDKQQEISTLQQEKSLRSEVPSFNIEIQQLRIELERSQIQIVTLRTELQRLQQSNYDLNSQLESLRRAVEERQGQLVRERREAQWSIEEAISRSKGIQNQKERLESELLELKLRIERSESFEKELYSVREHIALKEKQISNLKTHLESKNQSELHLQSQISQLNQQLLRGEHNFEQRTREIHQTITQEFHLTITELQNHISRYELELRNYQLQITQREQRIHILSQQCEEYLQVQRNHQNTIQTLHLQYRQEITLLRQQIQRLQSLQIHQQRLPHPPTTSSTLEDHSLLINPYLQEIQRLNLIIRQLQSDLQAFKLKLLSMITHENRIEQNLSAMVRLFNDVINVKQNIEVREVELGEVRRSFIKKASSDGGSEKSQKEEGRKSSLQGSLVQQGQTVRSGFISIKVGGLNQEGLARQVESGGNLSSSHHIQQTSGELSRPSQHISHSGSSYNVIQTTYGQTGTVGGIRTANYIIPPVIVHRTNAASRQ